MTRTRMVFVRDWDMWAYVLIALIFSFLALLVPAKSGGIWAVAEAAVFSAMFIGLVGKWLFQPQRADF